MTEQKNNKADMNSPKNQLFQKVDHVFTQIANARGKEKKRALKECLLEHGMVTLQALDYLLNPYIVFGIGEKSLKKPLALPPDRSFTDLFDLLDYLKEQLSITDQILANVQAFVRDNPDFQALIEGMVTKSIRLGISGKTVNEVFLKPCIPTFSCMLANKYFDHPDAVEGKVFAITEKLDGIRCLGVVEKTSVHLFSRQGQPIEGMLEIEHQLLAIREKCGMDFVMDGELLVSYRDTIPSKEQYKRTTQIVRSNQPHKTGITYNAFDILELEAFQTQHCEMPYYMRRQRLETFASLTAHPNIRVVPVEYIGSDTSQIQVHLNRQRSLNHEGNHA